MKAPCFILQGLKSNFVIFIVTKKLI